MKLSDIKQFDDNCTIVNDCEFDILGLIGKEYAKDDKVISFLGNPAYIDQFLRSKMAGTICTQEIADSIANQFEGGICVVNHPKDFFWSYHNYLAKNTNHYGEVALSVVNKSAIIHPRAIIAANNVVIGEHVYIGANTVIHEGTVIEDYVIIREGCVIGTPAFYYYGTGDNKTMVESVGRVLIEENVQIHANVIVEKGVIGGSTKIGKNTKIDNTVLVGHDTHIGGDCVIAGGAVFAGGVSIGDNVSTGVSVNIAPNVVIGNDAMISVGAVVTKNVPDDIQVSGNFAIEHKQFLKNLKASVSNEETIIVKKITERK